ncbi:MAG: HNH endonuclease [Alphaproteobacteria bacterium]|nr:HNH endonuclease [Alphaproteobacteria bacterium]
MNLRNNLPHVDRWNVDGGITQALEEQLSKIRQCSDGYGRLAQVTESCYQKLEPITIVTCANCLSFEDCFDNESIGEEGPIKRSWKRTGTIKPKLRFRILKRDNFTCQYCGRKAPDVVLHVDHIKPITQNGSNDLRNLITACAECNIGKSNDVIVDE